MPAQRAARRRGLLLVLGGTVLWSLAGYFARLIGHLDVGTVLFARAGFGGLCISAWAVFEHRRGVLGPRFGFGPLSPLIVLLSATAISSYIAAVMTTTVADVLVIYATLPFVAAGLSFLINKERVSRRTLISACVATVGVVIMVASGLGSGRLLGQALSMLMTVTFALMVVLQRRDPAMSMTSINAAAAFLAATFGYTMSAHPALDLRDLIILFLFGLTTVCVAFVMFMEGAKFVPSAEAGLVSMLDVALGPLWVFLAFGENPGRATLIGGAFVIGAVIWRVIPEIAGEPRAKDVTSASWPL
ncbi:MAG TPA: EamA family transporter [Roseiarcus sp.]|jgi:drug/metabolite transporter (DMT)-like permease